MNNTDLKNMTVEQFIAMKNAMDEAENDNTPYAVVANDQIQVIGDVGKTEVKKHEYKIQFGYPNTEEWRKALEGADVRLLNETENYIGAERTYKNVWVSPRMHTAVQTSFVELYRFFVATNDDGELRDMDANEIVEVLRLLDQQMIDAMCHAVGSVLHIPVNEEEYILLPSAVEAIMQMIKDFPEIINGVDFFTGRSSEMTV